MPVNRSLLFFATLLFSQCRYAPSPDDPVLEGPIYSGKMQVVNIHGFGQHTLISHVSLSLVDRQFWITLPDGHSRGCSGWIVPDTAAQKFDFQSSDCACRCNCAPNIDCVGDPILGEFSFQESGASLFLQKNMIWGPADSFEVIMHLVRQ